MKKYIYAISRDFDNINLFTDDQFIYEAKKEKLFWSLEEFQELFNSGLISDEWYIRII